MTRTERKIIRFTLALSVISVIPWVMWVARIRIWYGDIPMGLALRSPMGIVVAEPIGAILSSYFHEWFREIFAPRDLVQLESFILGIIGIFAMPLLWRKFGVSSILLLAHAGIFFYLGYVEIGTPFFAAIIPWYVASWAYRRTVCADILLAIGILCHGSLACWLLPHIWVRRKRFWIVLLALAVGIAFVRIYKVHYNVGLSSGFAGYIGYYLGNISAPMRWINGSAQFHFFSMYHLQVVMLSLVQLNLMGCLVIYHCFAAAREREDFLAPLCAVGSAFLVVVWYPFYGYYADWDLFSSWAFASGWAMMLRVNGWKAIPLAITNLAMMMTLGISFYVKS